MIQRVLNNCLTKSVVGTAIPSENQQYPSQAATPEENYCLKNQSTLNIYPKHQGRPEHFNAWW